MIGPTIQEALKTSTETSKILASITLSSKSLKTISPEEVSLMERLISSTRGTYLRSLMLMEDFTITNRSQQYDLYQRSSDHD